MKNRKPLMLPPAVMSPPGTNLMSRVLGDMTHANIPRPLLRLLIKAYSAKFSVNLGEIEKPTGDYGTFSEFFTRRLRPGARIVASAAVVSPVDAKVQAIGAIKDGGFLEQIKGHDYSVSSFLGIDEHPFKQGVFAVLYLSPRDYHRFHAPLDSRVLGFRYIKGHLVSVKPWFHRVVAGLLVSNERVHTHLETRRGPAVVSAVGATGVGRIHLSYTTFASNLPGAESCAEELRRPVEMRAGEELGYFDLGSTIVLLFADAGLRPQVEVGQKVEMGQALFA